MSNLSISIFAKNITYNKTTPLTGYSNYNGKLISGVPFVGAMAQLSL